MRHSDRPSRRGVRLAAVPVAAAIAILAPVTVATASTPTSTATVTGPTGTGTAANPIVYEVDFDCDDLQNGTSDTATLLATPTVGLYYGIVLNVKDSSTGCGSVSSIAVTTTNPSPKSGFDTTYSIEQQYSGSVIRLGASTSGSTAALWEIVASSSSSASSAPDPRAQSVAVVAEQVAASGVEGSASGVRVRDGQVLPVTSRVSGAVGPRGGVVLDSDGMQVRVASVLGARADAGVIVPSNGVFEASVTGRLVPGSVVEVWINSEPRLVAAGEVPEDGDSVTVAIPTGTPLDGGDPIEDGEHTLELRLFTEDGYEIIATGITVGQVAPTRVPAGEGPAPLGGALGLFAGVLLVAAVAGRRVLVRD